MNIHDLGKQIKIPEEYKNGLGWLFPQILKLLIEKRPQMTDQR